MTILHLILYFVLATCGLLMCLSCKSFVIGVFTTDEFLANFQLHETRFANLDVGFSLKSPFLLKSYLLLMPFCLSDSHCISITVVVDLCACCITWTTAIVYMFTNQTRLHWWSSYRLNHFDRLSLLLCVIHSISEQMHHNHIHTVYNLIQ